MKKERKKIRRKRVPTIKVGTHKKLAIVLWILLLGSVSFGIYKNFTAININTIHEKTIIEKQIVDTNQIESFVQNFTHDYFSWERSQESIINRVEKLKNYLTEDLQKLNADTIRIDIPTSSAVSEVQIWNVEQNNEYNYEVIFSVKQIINENGANRSVVSTYSVVVYLEDSGNMVIIKNPTMCSKPIKSNYQPKKNEFDGTVDATMSNEIDDFLDTFFKLYPTATEKELAYYVKGNVLKAVGKNYVFEELIDPVYTKTGKEVKVSVSVKYLDQNTKVTHISQFELTLTKSNNWLIVNA